MPPAMNEGIPVPVVFDIEPSENGEVLYQRVAPPAQGEPARAMVYFSLRARNQTNKPLTAGEMTISFPGSAVPSIVLASRNRTIQPGASAEIGLEGGEEFLLPANAPATIRISVAFSGLAAPVAQTWPLVPHARTWAFFARPEASAGYGEYIILPGKHMGGGGGQHFAYDANVLGVNQQGDLSTSKTGSQDNSDTFLWGRPIYAMADGIVVRAVDEHPDNPSRSERAFARKAGSYEGSVAVSAIAVDNLDSSRIFAAVISGGHLKVLALQQNADASELDYLAGANGPAAEGELSVAGIERTRAVTAHTSGGSTRLTLWDIASNGSSVTQLDDLQISGVTSAKVVKLLSRRVAVMGRKADGKLSLTIHEWSNSGQFAAATVGSSTGGATGVFDFIALTATRLVAAVQTGSDGLKVIVWDIGIGGNQDGLATGSLSLTRVGEAEGLGSISEVALAARDSTQIATAVRTSNNRVKLICWDVVESGAVMRRGDVTGEEGEDISLSFFKTKSYAVGYRTASGKLRLVAWEANQNENTKAISFVEKYQRDTHGTTNLFAITRVPTAQPTIVTAVRTQTGVLKVILWQFTDSNLIYILHGDEIISFVHLKQGSVPDHLLVPGTTVMEGEMVGRMGHSGKSSGPHLHLQATRVRPDLLADINLLIAELEKGKEVGAFRPLQFRNVRGMRAQNLVSGWDNNPMSLFDGEGAYLETYAVWPWSGHVQQATAPGKTRAPVAVD